MIRSLGILSNATSILLLDKYYDNKHKYIYLFNCCKIYQSSVVVSQVLWFVIPESKSTKSCLVNTVYTQCSQWKQKAGFQLELFVWYMGNSDWYLLKLLEPPVIPQKPPPKSLASGHTVGVDTPPPNCPASGHPVGVDILLLPPTHLASCYTVGVNTPPTSGQASGHTVGEDTTLAPHPWHNIEHNIGELYLLLVNI